MSESKEVPGNCDFELIFYEPAEQGGNLLRKQSANLDETKSGIERLCDCTWREIARIMVFSSLVSGGMGALMASFTNHNHQIKKSEPEMEFKVTFEVVAKKISSPFSRVLKQAEREKDPSTDTYRSRLLEPEAVSKHFLKDKLIHTSVEINRDGEEFYHFSIIGDKSGYWKDGKKTAPVLRSAAEAVEILIDPSHRNPEEVVEWLSWLYQKNGWGNLENTGLKIEVDGKGKVQVLAMKLSDKNKVALEVAADIEKVGYIVQKNAISKEAELQPIADSRHNLLIPSGIAPLHDIVVPAKYLIMNPQFELPLGNGKKILVDVKSLDVAVQNYLNLDKKHHSVSESIPKNDPIIEKITQSIIRPKMKEDRKYLALGRYIQTTTSYRSELDAEENRPGLVTLFNGGSDCNNQTVLYAEMAYHAGLSTALIRLDNNNQNKLVGHMMAGVPARVFPAVKALDLKKEWVGYEMAGDVTLPGINYLGENWVVTEIEPVPTEVTTGEADGQKP